MNRFTSILNGMDIVNVAENEAGYNYYGFNRWGCQEWAILRENTAGTEYLYKLGSGSYETNFANRGSLTGWKKPSQYNV